MSLLRPILTHALRHPMRVAIEDDRRKVTYLKLALGMFYLADAIEKLTRRQNVGLLLPTSSATPICIMGAWQAGRTPIPFNYLLSKDELHYVIKHSDVDTLLTVQPMLDFLGGREALRDDVNVVSIDKLKLPKIPPLRWPRWPAGDELATILYTSGTSGRPKGVMLTHTNLYSNVRAAICRARFRTVDVFLGVLPQFHSFGLTALTWAPLALGSKVVYTARFIPRKIVDLIRKHRPTVFVGVPSMYNALLSLKDPTADDFKSVKVPVSGGEPLSDAVVEGCHERFGLDILEGYGLTETSPVVSWATPWLRRRGAVGAPLGGLDVAILDEHDRPLSAESEGEIAIAGPSIMPGYYKDVEQTNAVMLDINGKRFFRTGDIGKLDSDGFLFITGRKKEMLIIAGENVFPREIEEALAKHPTIHASGVIGIPDPTRGEMPIAFVELTEGSELNESDLRSHLRQHIANYKVPKEFRVLEELPRSPTGKVLRRKLHELL